MFCSAEAALSLTGARMPLIVCFPSLDLKPAVQKEAILDCTYFQVLSVVVPMQAVDEETQKAMLAYYHKKQEDEKVCRYLGTNAFRE